MSNKKIWVIAVFNYNAQVCVDIYFNPYGNTLLVNAVNILIERIIFVIRRIHILCTGQSYVDAIS